MGDVRITARELEVLHKKYPNHICVWVQPSSKATDLPPIDKQKYLVPKDLTVGAFIFMIRKRMTLPPEKALFLFVNNTLPTSSSTLAELYAAHGSVGYLHVMYAGESTFGGLLRSKLPTS
jgi:GABA(A) receptor-associated protein